MVLSSDRATEREQVRAARQSVVTTRSRSSTARGERWSRSGGATKSGASAMSQTASAQPEGGLERHRRSASLEEPVDVHGGDAQRKPRVAGPREDGGEGGCGPARLEGVSAGFIPSSFLSLGRCRVRVGSVSWRSSPGRVRVRGSCAGPERAVGSRAPAAGAARDHVRVDMLERARTCQRARQLAVARLDEIDDRSDRAPPCSRWS